MTMMNVHQEFLLSSFKLLTISVLTILRIKLPILKKNYILYLIKILLPLFSVLATSRPILIIATLCLQILATFCQTFQRTVATSCQTCRWAVEATFWWTLQLPIATSCPTLLRALATFCRCTLLATFRLQPQLSLVNCRLTDRQSEVATFCLMVQTTTFSQMRRLSGATFRWRHLVGIRWRRRVGRQVVCRHIAAWQSLIQQSQAALDLITKSVRYFVLHFLFLVCTFLHIYRYLTFWF